ncbi:MAG TPA: thioredoxin family protein [Acidimicrobiales bacterium]
MKWVIVAAILFALVFARGWYLRYRAAVAAERPVHPRVPRDLLGRAERTWVVFTTPYCASCGPVQERLASADPTSDIVTVDAAREPHLARAFHVKSAPTVLLANAAGDVQERLVGAAAVDRYLALSYQA